MIRKVISVILLITMSCFLCCCNSDSSNNENAGMEEGWDPKIVSMNGSRLYTKDDVPEAVIDAAIKYISDNGYDDQNIEFVICRHSGKYSAKVERLFELDYFDPDISEKDDSPYYVKERAKEPAADIGYFAVDLSGNITEQKRLKTYDEIVKIDSFFKYDADHAMKAAADHFSADYDDIRSTAKYLDEIDGKEVLCYRVQIKRRKNDKFILLNARINGENGEIFYTDEFEFIDGTWQKKEG